MFIVLGILSVLSAGFVFWQGGGLSVFSALAGSAAGIAVSRSFLLVAACLLVGGILCFACGSGRKRGILAGSAAAYYLAAFVGLVVGYGDLRIWAAACLLAAAACTARLFRRDGGADTGRGRAG